MKGNRTYRVAAGRATLREVDLHLPSGRGGPVAIDRQLARFRGEMNSAVRAGMPEIVFIHGVGTGKLKEEIRRILAAEYPGCSYQDAPFSRYGFGGATLVTIKK